MQGMNHLEFHFDVLPSLEPKEERITLSKVFYALVSARNSVLDAMRREKTSHLVSAVKDVHEAQYHLCWYDYYRQKLEKNLATEQRILMMISDGDRATLQTYAEMQAEHLTTVCIGNPADNLAIFDAQELQQAQAFIEHTRQIVEKEFRLLEAIGRSKGNMDDKQFRHDFFDSIIAYRSELDEMWKEIDYVLAQLNLSDDGSVYDVDCTQDRCIGGHPLMVLQSRIGADIDPHNEAQHLLEKQDDSVAAVFVVEDGAGRLHVEHLCKVDDKNQLPESMLQYERELEKKIRQYNQGLAEYEKQVSDRYNLANRPVMPKVPEVARNVAVFKRVQSEIQTIDDVLEYMCQTGIDLSIFGI